MMKRNLLLTTATFLCLLTLFGIPNTALAAVLNPPDSASITTPEGVMFTESFTGPATCELGVDCAWILRIEVKSTVSDLNNVLVEETLSADIEVNTAVASHGTVHVDPMGSKPDKSSLNITWTINSLTMGQMAYIVLEISTDLNPAGRQEYTSCGCNNLNSGPRLTYYIGTESTRSKYSDWNWVWEVCVPSCEGVPLFTDVLRILPVATIAGALVVTHRRRW